MWNEAPDLGVRASLISQLPANLPAEVSQAGSDEKSCMFWGVFIVQQTETKTGLIDNIPPSPHLVGKHVRKMPRNQAGEEAAFLLLEARLKKMTLGLSLKRMCWESSGR